MRSLWLDTHRVDARTSRLRGGESYDTVVVGAGLTGLATAVMLARAGQRVAVIEGRGVGAAATGHTTGKLSLLQGTQLSRIRERHGDEVLRAYVASNLAGQEWLLGFMPASHVDHQHRPAVSYATTDSGRQSLTAELDAAVAADLPVRWTDDPGLPFPVTGALLLPDQVQLHPTELLDALAHAFVEFGGVLCVNNRVQRIHTDRECRITTPGGEVAADNVVLATGTPILDRGGHFSRLRPLRSYALAFRVPAPIPSGMYLSVDQPTRSLRTAPVAGEERLLVGGNGHPVGRHESPARLVADLESWTAAYFPGAVRTHVWSAQDYRPANTLPIVGVLPFSSGRVQVATGYNKWGIANALAAAVRIVANLGGDRPAWAATLDKASPTLAGAGDVAGFGISAAGGLVGGWARAEARPLPADPPAEGQGVVGRLGGRPAARATVDRTTHTVTAVCTHLGGVLRWNDAECSWDCPLHGSRFDASGRVLEGPAVRDLAPLE